MVRLPWKRKSREEEMLEKQIEGNLLIQSAATQATHELIREEGVSIWIVKDPDLQNILLSFGCKPVADENGNFTGAWMVEDVTLSSLLILHGTIFQTGVLSPWMAEYLKRTVDVILARKELSIKMGKNGTFKSILEAKNLLDVLRAYYYNIIDSAVEGRRVVALKTQPRVIRTRVEREGKRGIL